MVNFDDPKTVAVQSLPEGYDPTKKRFNSLKTLVNWRGQNYIEDFKDADKENEDASIKEDVEARREEERRIKTEAQDIEAMQLREERSEKEFCDTV